MKWLPLVFPASRELRIRHGFGIRAHVFPKFYEMIFIRFPNVFKTNSLIVKSTFYFAMLCLIPNNSDT